MKTRLIYLGLLALAACGTDGTSVTTGTTRPSIDKSQVVLYLTPPAKYETIGLVTAKSGNHGSDQSKMDDAVDKLKEEAANVGANGILIAGTGEQTSGGSGVVVPAGNNALIFTSEHHRETINGTAIYVPTENVDQAVLLQPGDLSRITTDAESGDAAAQYKLGMLYMQGTGVPQNYVEAAKWLILAKADASPDSGTYRSASGDVDSLESRMTSSQIEQAQQAASAWFQAHTKTNGI
ncbi:MAG TPA: hypothetical protein VGH91_11690 [Gammaproteobacteria bacterium]|jgi:hypothetical protein